MSQVSLAPAPGAHLEILDEGQEVEDEAEGHGPLTHGAHHVVHVVLVAAETRTQPTESSDTSDPGKSRQAQRPWKPQEAEAVNIQGPGWGAGELSPERPAALTPALGLHLVTSKGSTRTPGRSGWELRDKAFPAGCGGTPLYPGLGRLRQEGPSQCEASWANSEPLSWSEGRKRGGGPPCHGQDSGRTRGGGSPATATTTATAGVESFHFSASHASAGSSRVWSPTSQGAVLPQGSAQFVG